MEIIKVVAFLVVVWCSLSAAARLNGGVSSKRHDSEPRPDLAEALRMFYDVYKREMRCGNPQMGLPVMAPFKLENYNMNFSGPQYQVTGSVSNIVITGLDDFSFLKLNYDNDTQTLSYDFMFPQVQYVGEYDDVVVSASVAGYPLIFGGSGLTNWKFTDVRSVASISFAPVGLNDTGLTITDLQMNFFLGDVEFNNVNYNIDVASINFINSMMRETVLLMAQEYQEEYNALLIKYVVPQLNALLADTNMEGLVDFFVNMSKEIDTKCDKK